MMGLPESDVAPNLIAGSSSNLFTDKGTISSKEKSGHRGFPTSWTTLLTFSLFDTTTISSSYDKKEVKSRNYGWVVSLRKALSGGPMRRLQERILGTGKTDISSSTSEIWLLGACYKTLPEGASTSSDPEDGLVAFQQDFSSRVWITYRKGFNAIGESRFSSDVNWGCMIRSSQMLVAQALIFHHLGRSWRRTLQKPHDPKYIEILHLFGDSKDSAFSIHNLILAGSGYGLAAGSWVGPYAMCRSWEVLSRSNRDNKDIGIQNQSLPMAVYIVSGDEDGERGGAPVVQIDVASELCSKPENGKPFWAPILLLVPLVLGLDKINPRYIPLLWATFTFPQSLGILGGKPGASTYIIGVQDEKAFYLDPHEVQPAITISRDNFEVDTSSYHCSTVRQLALEHIDPSLAIGFYCRDKDDFDDFCVLASELADRSNGAPLFTVAQSSQVSNKNFKSDDAVDVRFHDSGNSGNEEVFHEEHVNDSDVHQHEDDWQLL